MMRKTNCLDTNLNYNNWISRLVSYMVVHHMYCMYDVWVHVKYMFCYHLNEEMKKWENGKMLKWK